MTKDHIHNKPYSIGEGELVCNGCITEEQKGNNECFCKCHLTGSKTCGKCQVYHNG